ncbi:hypothetical protein QQF64_024564 [Cirrhinus molitorella]|uniref:Secreted protein n=1 Tax=Cirrhinus molitorella TaxID=172907 RepID=A0ABR3NM76_9TELE
MFYIKTPTNQLILPILLLCTLSSLCSTSFFLSSFPCSCAPASRWCEVGGGQVTDDPMSLLITHALPRPVLSSLLLSLSPAFRPHSLCPSPSLSPDGALCLASSRWWNGSGGDVL